MMQVASNARKLSRVLRAPIFLQPGRFLISDIEQVQHSLNSSSSPWQSNQRSFTVEISDVSGIATGIHFPVIPNAQNLGHHVIGRACYSSEASTSDEVPSGDVKEIYDKMHKSVEGETMPRNACLWSLIEKCLNREDIKLLFQMLSNLRRFRLSNLRMHSNFNSNLCTRVFEACTRVGALDFGKRTLWEHNVYGLTPSIASAHNLLEGDLKYTLFRVLVHTGWSTHSGHYYCFFRTSTGVGHFLDDNMVVQVSERNMLEQKEYMLFYVHERTNLAPKKPTNAVHKENMMPGILTDTDHCIFTTGNKANQNGPSMRESGCSSSAALLVVGN